MTESQRNEIIGILLAAHERTTTGCTDCILRRGLGDRTPQECCDACRTQNRPQCTKSGAVKSQ